jgi:hypothetical protein
MTIPREWLVSPTTLAEVEEHFEEYLAYQWLPDVWWDQWRTLINQIGPDDELWEYSNFEEGPAAELYEDRSGYALVRGGEVIDFLECLDPF